MCNNKNKATTVITCHGQAKNKKKNKQKKAAGVEVRETQPLFGSESEGRGVERERERPTAHGP